MLLLKFFQMNVLEALVVFCLVVVTTVQCGPNGAHPDPVPEYNPVNAITINNCGGNTHDEDLDNDIQPKLTVIKGLMNTLIEEKDSYNPPILNCCNRTEEDNDLQQELSDIKGLVKTMIKGLENGDDSNESPSYPRDCYEVQAGGETASGVYTIKPNRSEPFKVYCDMVTDGGGWTVFQRRKDGTEDFFKTWWEYVKGFGALEGEHWLGNENLYYLTNQKTYALRIDLEDFDDIKRFAKYNSFIVSDSADNYRMQIGAYSGDAGDGMLVSNNQQFSTRDQDNDMYSVDSCARLYRGAWWYNACHEANLNGVYLVGTHSTNADGVNWYPWHGYYYSLKFSEMKLRPVPA